jgi:uncharacterized membrane protein
LGVGSKDFHLAFHAIYSTQYVFSELRTPNSELPTPNSQPLPLMSEWLEHSVQIEVAAPIDLVWSLWQNLELMPRYFKWIESVEILEDTPELSRWKLAVKAFEFTWLARSLQEVPNQLIQWESVDGLPNKGAIRFYDRKESSIVKLTVAYAVPGFLAVLMNNDFVRNAVESTLQADMETFRVYAMNEVSASRNAPEVL